MNEQDIARFWSKIDKNSSSIFYGGERCWEWTAGLSSGYGSMSIENRTTRMHRCSWEIHNGAIPKNMFVCHHCDNRKCCNPNHLFLGLPIDNVRDGVLKGRMSPPPRNQNKGESNGRRKLSAKEVDFIRKEAIAWDKNTANVLANKYNISPKTIRNIVKGKIWKS